MSDSSTANKATVIILCTDNSARSQTAEGFLRTYAGDSYNVHSAGLESKRVNPSAIKVMQEIRIDIPSRIVKCP